jgi:methylmalonyl-CoA mutase
VRVKQLERLAQLKAERNPDAVKAALEAITASARTGEGNLLALAVEAAKVRATLGEISDALEVVWGRYQAKTQSVSGVYIAEFAKSNLMKEIKQLVADFEKTEGRRPRIMVAKLGQDGHDRGAKVVATAYADMGFDVDIGPLFQTPAEAAKQAVENDVHIIGMSSLAEGTKPSARARCGVKAARTGRIMIVVGGVIPCRIMSSC